MFRSIGLQSLTGIPLLRSWQHALSLKDKDTPGAVNKCDVLFFSHDTNRGSRLGELPFSPLTDLLNEDLRRSGLRTEQVSRFGSRQKVVYPNLSVYRFNRLFLRAHLADVFASILRPGLKQFHLEHVFSQILKESGAKLIISVGLPKSLARAARQSGVYLIEILHGFGYSPLPWDYASREARELANEFWIADRLSLGTFSSLETLGVQNTLIKPLQLVPITKSPAGGETTNTKLGPPSPSKTADGSVPKRKIVLFALSRGGYFGQPIDGQTNDWDLIERLVANSTSAIRWFFRIHPVQVAEGTRSRTFRKVLALASRFENCEWEWATTSPPSMVYQEMDCLATWGSEAIFDAFFSGLTSGVILPEETSPGDAPGQHKAFDYLAKKGGLNFLKPDVQEILSWLEKQAPISASSNAELGATDFDALVKRCLKLVAGRSA